MPLSLTPPERETIISISDADDHWLIHTWQRQLMTKLDGNPSAQRLQEHRCGARAARPTGCRPSSSRFAPRPFTAR